MKVGRLLACTALAAAAGLGAVPARAQILPQIRITDSNRVPACVTTARLMAFVRERNPRLDPRYDEIAKWYKAHGEQWRVRWDYAFYQMIVETNHLMFRAGNGRQGDVNPRQNNFAGIGTTGGGVAGDGYPDVSTGVLAQIQHLVAYSGERMDKPVAPRTQLKQDDIIAMSVRLRRPVTFADLAGRWAADRRYARSIEAVADRFRSAHCNGNNPISDDPGPLKAAAPALPKLKKPPVQVALRLRPSITAAAAAPVPAAPSTPSMTCHVQSASYVGKTGNRKTLLIKAVSDSEQQFTALQVLDGFERSMSDTFIRTRAPGGITIGEFETIDAALAEAYQLCPSAR